MERPVRGSGLGAPVGESRGGWLTFQRDAPPMRRPLQPQALREGHPVSGMWPQGWSEVTRSISEMKENLEHCPCLTLVIRGHPEPWTDTSAMESGPCHGPTEQVTSPLGTLLSPSMGGIDLQSERAAGSDTAHRKLQRAPLGPPVLPWPSLLSGRAGPGGVNADPDTRLPSTAPEAVPKAAENGTLTPNLP